MLQTETAPWLLFRAWNTDGTPKSDLVYNTAGIVLYQSRNNEAKSTITLSNASSATDWAAGKFWQISGNLYRVGASTASISSYTGFITVQGSYTGGTLDGIAIEVRPAAATPADVPTAAANRAEMDSNSTKLATIETSTTTTIPELIPTAIAIADQVWDEATAGHTTAGTYGGRVVRSTNSNVEVQITGSNHIAADVHELQTGVITAGDFSTDAITAAALAADAVTEIQSGLASQASVDVIDGIVDTILVDTNDLQTNQGAWLTATSVTVSDKTGFSIAGTINTLDQLDTAQDTQHGTTRTAVDDAFTVIKGATWSGTTDTLEAIRDRGDVAWITGAGGGSGTGARTITVTIDDGTDPLENATVRMTEGVNTYTALSDVTGVATFNLDDATYVVAITKSGYSYAGTTLVVDGDETETYSLTQVTPTIPDDPALCTVTIPVVNQYGAALVGEVVEIRFNQFTDAATATAVVLSPPPTLTSDADGNVIVELLRDADYSVFYGQDDYIRRLDFSVPDADSYAVGE